MRKIGQDNKQFKDFSGKRFGKLLVLGFSHYKVQPSGQKKTQWNCLCDCGTECLVAGANLTTNHTTSCGCHRDIMKSEGLKKYRKHIKENGVHDLVGVRFGRLKVLQFHSWSNKDVNGSIWSCLCDCGETCLKARNCLADYSSCGCWKSEKISEIQTKHGMTESDTYKTWRKMKERCSYPNERQYTYKEKNIKVCDRWLNSFENFLEDMGERPDIDGITLDRIDNNKGYYKENCRWADKTLQSFNRTKRESVTGITGVRLQRNGLYSADIGFYRKKIVLIKNATIDEAVSARKAAELKYYGFNKE